MKYLNENESNENDNNLAKECQYLMKSMWRHREMYKRSCHIS